MPCTGSYWFDFGYFLEDSNIRAIFIDNTNAQLPSKWNSPIGETMVIKALKVLMHNEHYPILVTCKHGRTLTGSVIACLRKLQGWSLMSIFEEFRRFAGYKPQQRHEEFALATHVEGQGPREDGRLRRLGRGWADRPQGVPTCQTRGTRPPTRLGV